MSDLSRGLYQAPPPPDWDQLAASLEAARTRLTAPAQLEAAARRYCQARYAPRPGPVAPAQPARAIVEAAAGLGRQLAPIGAAIAAFGAAVSAQLTAAAGQYSGQRAGLGDPCGNPHPPFRPPP